VFLPNILVRSARYSHTRKRYIKLALRKKLEKPRPVCLRHRQAFSVGVEISENVDFHSAQKTVFDKLAVGKKLKKKAKAVFVVKKQKVLITDGYFAEG
jgi:hypothetical protein